MACSLVIPANQAAGPVAPPPAPLSPPPALSAVRAPELLGLKQCRRLQPMLDKLHEVGTERDRAGNRQFFFDQYTRLLLLYFFNPVVTSLRGLQQLSGLAKVQQAFDVPRVSLGSLSEASGVFPAAPLSDIVQQLAAQAVPLHQGREAEALRGLTAVDGTVLRALPQMAWALWQDEQHRAAKMHLHFEVFKGVPVAAQVSPAACSEPAHLRAMLQPNRLYVIDRGYADYQLFRDILDAGSSFVGRVKDNTAFTVKEERPLTAAAQKAGVVRDVVVARLGTPHHKDVIGQPLRLVIIRRRKANGQWEELWLVTNLLDLPAELVALAYKLRWQVELFFRWFKCILGCRHLVAQDANGVAIQLYVALIASLLLVLATGRPATKRTWEMLQLCLLGWASLAEVQAHLERLRAQDEAKAKAAAAPQ